MKSETPKSADESGITTALLAVALLGVCATVAGGLLDGVRTAAGVAIGATAAAANLWVLARIVKAFLTPTGNKLPWTFITLIKFGVLFGGLYLLFRYEVVDVMPVVFGYLALPVGIVAAQLRPAAPDSEETRVDA